MKMKTKTFAKSYINLSYGQQSALTRMGELFHDAYQNRPPGNKLRCMPVAHLQHGEMSHLRSITKAFDVVRNDGNDTDPFGLSKIYAKIEAEYAVKDAYYNEEEMSLNDLVFFRFWYLPQPGEGSDTVLKSLRNNALKLSEWGATDGLKILPKRITSSPEGDFVYEDRIFRVSNRDEGPNFPQELVNRYCEFIARPLVEMVDDHGLCVLCYRDYGSDNSDEPEYWVRLVWKPGSEDEYSYYVYNKSVLVNYMSPVRSCKFVEPKMCNVDSNDLIRKAYSDEKFGVLDIETITVVDGTLIPYAAGTYFGGPGNFLRSAPECKMFYLTDYPGECPQERAKLMMRDVVKTILVLKNRGYKIYAHNLSGFDGPLLVKYLSGMEGLKVRPLMVGTKVYKLKLSMKFDEMDPDWKAENVGPRGGTAKMSEHSRVTANIMDSMNLIPGSLRELCKVFDVETKKGEFPHAEVNWSNLSEFKKSCLEYLERDLVSLYQVLQAYGNRMSRGYGVDIHKHLSMASIAMEVYRTKFMVENEDSKRIPILGGKVDSDIRESFRGGVVGVFEPIMGKGVYLDVTSQYPAAMKKDMPVGIPKRCVNPDLSIEPGCVGEFFGFCEADIQSPPILDKPFLQTKHNGKTINPLGRWRGWYFSEELKAAKGMGYKVKTLRGYSFERGKDVFSGYVDHFFGKKAKAESPAERYIYKLMLNSLFGRWGMKDKHVECEVMGFEEFIEINNERHVTNHWELGGNGDNSVMVAYEKQPDITLMDDDNKFFNLMDKMDRNPFKHVSSVGIASATASYARIEFYKAYNKDDVAYVDTDGMYKKKSADGIPAELLGNHLGGLKCEGVVKSGLFITPKVYYVEFEDGVTSKFKGINKEKIKGQRSLYEELYKGESVTFDLNRLMRPRGGGVRSVDMKMVVNPPDESKRKMVYDDNGNWIGTKPLILVDGKIVDELPWDMQPNPSSQDGEKELKPARGNVNIKPKLSKGDVKAAVARKLDKSLKIAVRRADGFRKRLDDLKGVDDS